jgi:hypothetical protein
MGEAIATVAKAPRNTVTKRILIGVVFKYYSKEKFKELDSFDGSRVDASGLRGMKEKK